MTIWDAVKILRMEIYPQGECWVPKNKSSGDGYIVVKRNGAMTYAHRLVLGYNGSDTIDHLCRNRRCVNPDHLEIVSRLENSLRLTRCRICGERHVCPNGH